MKYQVTGIRTQHITVEIEANSPGEAVEKAQTDAYLGASRVDVWDTDDNFLDATELY